VNSLGKYEPTSQLMLGVKKRKPHAVFKSAGKTLSLLRLLARSISLQASWAREKGCRQATIFIDKNSSSWVLKLSRTRVFSQSVGRSGILRMYLNP